jgi:hypothetical protein
MRINIALLIIILKISKIFMVYSFMKRPFQINNNKSNLGNSKKDDKKGSLKLMDKIRSNKDVRLPAILEVPVEGEIKWEEGEIPWELLDNDNSTISSKSSINGSSPLDPSNIAFLFI